MTLLDASALLILLLGEPGEEEVVDLLRDGGCAMPAPCLAEVVDQMVRRRGVEAGKLSEYLGPLLDESVEVLGVGATVAWRAGELLAERYDRRRSPLSLADCMLLAGAGDADRIASSDVVLLSVAADMGVATVALG